MHWVAIHVDSYGYGHYFDSYGIPPFMSDHIKSLRKTCKRFRWSSKQLQSETSDVCGQFCLMFSHYMTNGSGFAVLLCSFNCLYELVCIKNKISYLESIADIVNLLVNKICTAIKAKRASIQDTAYTKENIVSVLK